MRPFLTGTNTRRSLDQWCCRGPVSPLDARPRPDAPRRARQRIAPLTARPSDASDAPRVAVWRNEWLAASETFIYNQIGATHRWKPLPVGLRVVPGGLPLRPARVLGD